MSPSNPGHIAFFPSELRDGGVGEEIAGQIERPRPYAQKRLDFVFEADEARIHLPPPQDGQELLGPVGSRGDGAPAGGGAIALLLRIHRICAPCSNMG
jgi:hypothetical protein